MEQFGLQMESPGRARAILNGAERGISMILIMRFVNRWFTIEVKISPPRKRR
jgi:hypothetical protein